MFKCRTDLIPATRAFLVGTRSARSARYDTTHRPRHVDNSNHCGHELPTSVRNDPKRSVRSVRSVRRHLYKLGAITTHRRSGSFASSGTTDNDRSIIKSNAAASATTEGDKFAGGIEIVTTMSGKASSRKKATPAKRKHGGILNIPGAVKVSRGEKYLGQDMLLTESIYNGKVPEHAKGKLFHYIVESYDDETALFSVKYMKKAVEVGGSVFFAFEENEDSSISGITFKDVRDGQKKYHDASKVSIVAEAKEADKVREALENQRKNPNKADMSDINDILETNPAGGKADEILLLEFEKLPHDGNDPEKRQRWMHKSTGRAFWQHRTASKKGWDSGVWNK